MTLYIKKIILLSLSITFFSNLSSASPLLDGNWSGDGMTWSNGAFSSVKVNLAFVDQSLRIESITGGFASEALHIFTENADDSILWLDVNRKKIGTGVCRENTCTFSGVFGRNNEFTVTKTYSKLSENKMLYTSSVNGQGTIEILNMILQKNH